jgi:hypothetical protein
MSAPNIIYLQWGDVVDDYYGVTWNVDRINHDDIEYTRKDIADKQIATLTEQLKAAEEDATNLYMNGDHSDDCKYLGTATPRDCTCGWRNAYLKHEDRIEGGIQHESRKQG